MPQVDDYGTQLLSAQQIRIPNLQRQGAIFATAWELEANLIIMLRLVPVATQEHISTNGLCIKNMAFLSPCWVFAPVINVICFFLLLAKEREHLWVC
jgi:hypothetical protein